MLPTDSDGSLQVSQSPETCGYHAGSDSAWPEASGEHRGTMLATQPQGPTVTESGIEASSLNLTRSEILVLLATLLDCAIRC